MTTDPMRRSGPSRRRFLQLLAATAAAAALPPVMRARAATGPRVVVVGGGFAGATVARYLRMWDSSVSVTLIDPNPGHVACIGSNLVVTGALDLATLTVSYGGLAGRWGVNVLRDSVVGGDPVTRRLFLASGAQVEFDRLVLAPGIDFEPIPGLDGNLIPHAWKAGPQTLLLQSQLAAMPAGGTFVMTIPPAPYRCPPGPYERACLVADWARSNRPGSKVVVLDANPGIVAEAHTFQTAFDTTHAGIVDYRPGVQLESVDSERRIAYTSAGAVRADVLNVIPPQRAGSLVTPLLGSGARWVDVDPLSYESRRYPGVHVIGDAQATGQPKSGHMANAQAKVCADAILRSFAGLPPDPAPKTGSACYSPITHSTAGWLTVVFAYDPASGTMKAVPGTLKEAVAPSAKNFRRMRDWGINLFNDTFG